MVLYKKSKSKCLLRSKRFVSIIWLGASCAEASHNLKTKEVVKKFVPIKRQSIDHDWTMIMELMARPVQALLPMMKRSNVRYTCRLSELVRKGR